jgi:hypothetical protein
MMHPNGDDPRTSVVAEEPVVATPETGQGALPAPGAPPQFATRTKVRSRQQFAQNQVVPNSRRRNRSRASAICIFICPAA